MQQYTTSGVKVDHDLPALLLGQAHENGLVRRRKLKRRRRCCSVLPFARGESVETNHKVNPT